MPRKISPRRPLPCFDLKLALADLTNRPGKEAETRKTLEDLAREDPKRPEPWTGLGYLAWRRNQISEAAEALGKAYELGDHSPKLLWDFGRLAEREHPDDATNALMDLVKQEPERLDARMELAALNLNARRPGGALSILSEVHTVPADDAPRFFTLLANAQILLGDRAGARVTVARLAANVKTPEDRARVDQMQRYLEQAGGPAPVAARNRFDRRRPAWCVPSPRPSPRPCPRLRPRSKDPSLNSSVWGKASRWWSILRKDEKGS